MEPRERKLRGEVYFDLCQVLSAQGSGPRHCDSKLRGLGRGTSMGRGHCPQGGFHEVAIGWVGLSRVGFAACNIFPRGSPSGSTRREIARASLLGRLLLFLPLKLNGKRSGAILCAFTRKEASLWPMGIIPTGKHASVGLSKCSNWIADTLNCPPITDLSADRPSPANLNQLH